MKPGILDRYFLRRTAVVLGQSLLALSAFYILIDMVAGRAEDTRLNEVPWSTVLLYYAASLPEMLIRYMAPFATLVAGLLVVGAAAQDNEITAALAGGISPLRLLRGPLALAALLSLGLFAFQETAGVKAAQWADDLHENYFSSRPGVNRAPVSWANLSGPWTCHIAKYNPRAKTGEDVLIYAVTPEAHFQIEAERIFWDPLTQRWMLERGRWHEFDAETSRMVRSYGESRITLCPAPFTEPPEELFSLDQPPNTKTAGELREDLAHAASRGLHAAPYAVGYHLKFAGPGMPFVMIWLAIPFAMRLRGSGLAIGFGAAVALALAYQVVSFITAGLGYLGAFDPFWAAWLPNFLGWAAGIALFRGTPS